MTSINEREQMYNLCRDHVHAYVYAELQDGRAVDGIITGLDEENVYLAVPIEHSQQEQGQHDDNRFFGYGFPGYGFGYPRRRFSRLILPLTALAAISLLPWY
ncbi:hypothetical protein CV093_07930 [Oceanobacillus sp. 143]|uniref:Uncharacterized protein n=1 Tax=Oceanobacillus zhaokaii TaxID=2052660 RepID=A0A345PFJ5_9BACI|nr:hypothetical protein [Oceanobacillus zhaokaii]AXI08775.1 hypothetical protein CUC15_07535 [Oceanobacillus zhaokaii]QGS68489.1 hypothetical protein CV093_07930 [Oceanobacillus sp. 143]